MPVGVGCHRCDELCAGLVRVDAVHGALKRVACVTVRQLCRPGGFHELDRAELGDARDHARALRGAAVPFGSPGLEVALILLVIGLRRPVHVPEVRRLGGDVGVHVARGVLAPDHVLQVAVVGSVSPPGVGFPEVPVVQSDAHRHVRVHPLGPVRGTVHNESGDVGAHDHLAVDVHDVVPPAVVCVAVVLPEVQVLVGDPQRRLFGVRLYMGKPDRPREREGHRQQEPEHLAFDARCRFRLHPGHLLSGLKG